MAKMWFYTEPQFMESQSTPTTSNENDSFGPWLNSSGYISNGFNITNFFKRDIGASPLDYQPKAFAVTGGTVAIIKQIRNDNPLLDPADYVNIVLYPDSQPENLPDIKCFIYRNIEISSIADLTDLSSGNPKIYPDTSPRSTDLGKKIIESYNDFDGVTNYPTIVDAGQQLQNELNPLEDNIEDYFLKNFDPGTVSHLNLPRVEGGDWIGNFNSNGSSAGFEIMFDNINFHPITAIVTGYPGTDDIDGGRNYIQFSVSDAFELPHYQESLPNYLDPAAFYGSLIDVGVKFKVIQNEVPQNDDPYTKPVFSEVEKNGDSLYNDVISKFYNKNKVYIDIRDRWNMSYMFESFPFSTAPDDLRLSFHDEGVVSPNPSPFTFRYRDNLKWPLLVLSNADFGNGVGYELDNKKIIGLQFPSFDPSSESVAYFVDNKNMLLKSNPPLEDTGKDNSVLINLQNDGAWTTRFLIGFPFVDDGSNNVVVANYSKIRYIKHQHEYITDYDDFIDPNAGVIGSSINLELDTDVKDYLTPLFPVNMNLKWKNSPAGNLKSTVYYEGLYHDNTNEGGRDFFANIGIAHDAQNKVTFFAYSTKTPSRSTKGLIDTTFSLTSKSKEYDKSFLQSLVEEEKFGAKMIHRTLTYSNIIPNITLSDLRPADITEEIIDNERASQLEDFTSFEMTYSQYESLKQLTNTTGTNFRRLPSFADPRYKNNPRMFFHPVLVDRILETGKPPLLKYNWTVVGFSDENPVSLTRVYSGIFTYRIEGKNRNIEKKEDQPYTEGIGFSLNEQPTSTYHIKSTIYLIRGGNVTVQELKAYRVYALNNIQTIWNTFSNQGFTTPKRLDINDPVPVPQETILADQVEIKIATAEQWKRLRQGEALWLVEKGQDRSRILATPNKNIGIINFENTSGSPGVYTESSLNTPAHEFGHMLGLIDRYAYYTELGGATSVQINDNVGATIPIYVNDSDYKDEYRWKNNLYSTQRIVNAGDFGGLANYSDWMTGYPAQTIFITQQQWNIIQAVAQNGMSSAETINGSQYVFIFQQAADYAGLNFTGMVGGLPESDANFLNSTNPDRMDERIDDSNGSNPPSGWVYPVINNLIDPNDRYEVLKPRLGLALDDDTPNVGLNSFIPPAWRTQTAFVAGANLNLAPLLGANDQHRAPENSSVIGDAFGFNIWNQLRSVTPPGTTGISVLSNTVSERFAHDVIYNQQYYNRILIIRLVVEGQLPTQFDD